MIYDGYHCFENARSYIIVKHTNSQSYLAFCSWPEFMSFLEKAHANIGGNSPKTTSASETESGTEGMDTPRSSATPAQNRKNPGGKDGGKGKKDAGTTPRQKRRGQGKKGEDKPEGDKLEAPGTPGPERTGTPGMEKISEEKGGVKPPATPEPEKSPRDRFRKVTVSPESK